MESFIGTTYLYSEAPVACTGRHHLPVKDGTTRICIQGGTTNLYWPTGKHHLPIQGAGRDNLTIQGGTCIPIQGGPTYLQGGTITYLYREAPNIQGGTNYMYLHKWAPQHRQVPHAYAGWHLSKGHHLRYRGHYLPTQRGTTYLHKRAPLTYTGGHQSAWSDELPHPPRAVQGAVVGQAGSVSAIE